MPGDNDDVEALRPEISCRLHNAGQAGQIQAALLSPDETRCAHLDDLQKTEIDGQLLNPQQSDQKAGCVAGC
jgi:hypothetical protein